MLRLARVTADDVVYDLGCGDGRIIIAAAKLGARGVCVDIDPQRIRESRANAERAGVAERIRFRNEDLFDTEISGATVVTLFLWQSVNEKLTGCASAITVHCQETGRGTRIFPFGLISSSRPISWSGGSAGVHSALPGGR